MEEKIGNCQGDIFCPHRGVLDTVFNLHASLFTFDKDNNFVGGKTILVRSPQHLCIVSSDKVHHCGGTKYNLFLFLSLHLCEYCE